VDGNLTILINSVDVTSAEVRRSLNVSRTLTRESDNCLFRVRDTAAVIREGQEVQIYVGTTAQILFAGIVDMAPRYPFAGMQAWEYSVVCRDYSKVFDYRRVAEAYLDKTAKYIIEDLVSNYVAGAWGITTTNVVTGPTIEEISFNYLSPASCIKKICDLTGYSWYVDYEKDVHFFGSEAKTAPYEIKDDPDFSFFNYSDQRDMAQIRNRVTVSGGKFLSPPFTDTFTGDGTADEYELTDLPHNISILEDSVAKTVGIVNITVPATVDYIVDYWRKTVTRTAGNLGNLVVLSVTYSYHAKVVSQAEDSDAQTALVALEGGDGIREDRIIDDTITSVPEAHAIALSQIRDYAYAKIRGSFKTFEDGFDVGQRLTVAFSGTDYNGDYTITSVNIRCVQNGLLEYSITFAEKAMRVEDLLVKLLRKSDITATESGEGIDKIKIVEETIEFVDTNTIQTDTYSATTWGADVDEFKWGFAQWA